MFAAFKRIFGIPEPDKPSSAVAAKIPTAQLPTSPAVRYLPKSQVPTAGVEGVASDGSTWTPWRVDSVTGEQWFMRTSRIDGIADEPQINAIDFEHADEQVDAFDELDECDRKAQLMFRGHLLKARERDGRSDE